MVGAPLPSTANPAMPTARSFLAALMAVAACALVPAARAADTVNVYSIWPENWARPMFEEFEKATGVKVNFVRFSSGEALARVIAEKGNPKVDVLFGGPVETHAAGIAEGVFEALQAALLRAAWRRASATPTGNGWPSPTTRWCS
jgi:ABC-type thiamine transport system substrate-binding protein